MIVTTNTTIIHASHFAIEWKKIQDMAYIEVMVLYCQKSRGNYSLHLHPPPSGFFLVSSPQAAASLFMHPLEFSSLIYYMQCSAFEKLGNKKPPCFPPSLLWISLYGKCANGFFLYVGGTLGGVALVLQDICSILVIHEMLLLVLNKVLLTQRFR